MILFSLSFVYICIAVGDPIIKSNPINRLNPVIFNYKCLSKYRTWISTGIFHYLGVFVSSYLRNIHKTPKPEEIHQNPEEFEDTKGVIKIRKSKKYRQHNGQKKKDKQRSTKHYT